jgi:uncharacterized protein (TIGR02444 family)
VKAEGSLWRFAEAIYGHAEVSKACLFLQDECGADVNVLLFALWIAVEKKSLVDAATIREVDAFVRQWRQEVVMPLRAVRRRLKTGPGPAPDAATEALRSRLKDVEIESERIELAVLEGIDLGHLPETADKPVAQNALSVVASYGGNTDDQLVEQAIAAIARVVAVSA